MTWLKDIFRAAERLFCIHEYRMPEGSDDSEYRNLLTENLKEGESLVFARDHVCTKCGRETVFYIHTDGQWEIIL